MPIALPPTLRRLMVSIPLRWVLTVPFVVPTIGAVALVGYLSYRNGQQAVEDLGQQLVAETNARVTQELKTYLQIPLLINRLNVDAVNQGQLDLENVPALESALFNRLLQFDQVSAVLFGSPEGLFRLVDRLPDLYLVAANPPQPDQLQIYRLDNEGKRGPLVTTLTGLDVRQDRPWYQRAVTIGQPVWNPIGQYGSMELLTLDASQPVYDRATERLLGVFAVHIRIDYLSQFLRDLDISRSGRVIILDQAGALIATSSQEKPYKFGGGTGYHRQFQQLKIDESQDDLTRALGESLRQRPDRLKSLEQMQELHFRYEGELHYVRITPFQDPYGLQWQIMTVIPQSHFLEAIQDGTQQTLLLCLLTLGMAITLGVLATNQLTARFAQLNRVSRELATGNLDQRLPVDSSIYELNDLAQTYNQMADQLQQSFDRITTALAESEEKFTTIFRSSPDPIAIASLAAGRILEANDSLIEFFGYSRSEIIGHTALELNLWNNLDERAQYRALLQQQGSVRNLEATLRIQSGQIKTVLLSAEVRTLEGQDCVIVMHRDISARKQAEASLRQALQYVEAHFEHSPLAIVEWDRDGSILRWSPQAEKLFGWTVAEVMHRKWHELHLVYEGDGDRVTRELSPLLNGSITNLVVQNRNYNKDGRVMICQWYSSAVFDETGVLASVLSFAEDITNRFELERMKDEFISVISHELRTPLTSIRGALGILESGVFDTRPEKARHMLQIATNNSERLMRLVDDILHLERLESGKVQLIFELCPIAELMQQAVEGVQAIALKAMVTIQVTPLAIVVQAAPDGLIQVFTNLLGNAIKFSSPGDTVWLTAELQDIEASSQASQPEQWNNPPAQLGIYAEPTPHILFSIKDQGRGIPDSQLETIFGRFQQVDVSDSRQKGGTGLGLAICKSIVQQHNGQIWVESVLNEGSTFYFTLPLSRTS